MAKIKTYLYDAAAYFTSEEDRALYLQTVVDESEGGSAMIVTALGEIARARGWGGNVNISASAAFQPFMLRNARPYSTFQLVTR